MQAFNKQMQIVFSVTSMSGQMSGCKYSQDVEEHVCLLTSQLGCADGRKAATTAQACTCFLCASLWSTKDFLGSLGIHKNVRKQPIQNVIFHPLQHIMVTEKQCRFSLKVIHFFASSYAPNQYFSASKKKMLSCLRYQTLHLSSWYYPINCYYIT